MPEPRIVHEPSCADAHEPGLLSVDEARSKILDSLTPLTAGEKLPLRDALQRRLAEDIISSINVPGHTNSAMDGYAIAGADLVNSPVTSFTVIADSFAGAPFTGQCHSGECVRIMTGAAMPDGTDTVIMQEHIERSGDLIKVGDGHRTGQNVRQAGEDIAIGGRVLNRGRQLTPADLGVIASLGIAEVNVVRRPRVAFFSTGDELRSIGDGKNRPLKKGEVYDSNRYSLHGMLKRLEAEIIDMGVIRDKPDDLRKALQTASQSADAVITSGGVSVGEADYIKPILDEIGDINFWKISMKPGRPITFGQLGNAAFFGLPGNPVSVMVTFYQFVQPALEYLAGGSRQPFFTLAAKSTSRLRKRPGRYEFQRGILTQDADGSFSVSKTGGQGSGILTSMSQANCFILLDEQTASIEAGESVMVQPFSSFM